MEKGLEASSKDSRLTRGRKELLVLHPLKDSAGMAPARTTELQDRICCAF